MKYVEEGVEIRPIYRNISKWLSMIHFFGNGM